MRNKVRMFVNDIRIQNKLILSYLIVAIATVSIVSFYLTVRMNQITVNKAINDSQKNVSIMQYRMEEILNLAVKVSDMIYVDKNLAQILTKRYENPYEVISDYNNYENLYAYLKYYKELANITIYVDNDTLVSSKNITLVNDNIKAQKWYKQALEEKGMIRWYYGERETKNFEFLSLIRSIYNSEGKLEGVLVIDINHSDLRAILNDNPNNIIALDNNTISLSNNDIDLTKYLAQNVVKDSNNGNDYVVKNKLNSKDDYMIVNSFKASKSLRNKFQVITVLPEKDITGETNRIILSGLSIAIVTIVLSLVIIVFFSKTISGRIKLLREEMHRVVKGDLFVRDKIYGKDEIGQLYEDLKFMINSIRDLIDQVYLQRIQEEKLKVSQKEVEFKMLSSQINPHFLYNTLETIRMRAFCNGDKDTADIVKKLGKIMRRNLEVSGKPVTLQSELELIDGYLKIQSMRFEGMVTYEFIIAEDVDVNQYMILPLLLQPVVENAFIHGLEEKKEKGFIVIIIKREDNDLIINVEDNGIGIEKEKLIELNKKVNDTDGESENKSIGMRNVNERIKIYYGKEYGITIESEFRVGTSVKINLPMEEY